LLGCFVLFGCSCSTAPQPQNLSEDIVLPQPQEDIDIFEWEYEPFENVGRTSANVRWYFVDDGISWQHHQPELVFDLDRVEKYHEFVIREGLRIVFTTEATVRDFRFLSVMFNDKYSRENPVESERLYIVENVLYTLDELTPKIPLVITGIDWGGAVPINGFSFVVDGEIRYFAFGASGSDEEVLVYIEF